MKNRVRISVDGRSFTLVGEESEQHMATVAAYIDEKMKEIRGKSSAVGIDSSLAYILTAVTVTDEYFKEREKNRAFQNQQMKLLDVDGKIEKSEEVTEEVVPDEVAEDIVDAMQNGDELENLRAEIALLKEETEKLTTEKDKALKEVEACKAQIQVTEKKYKALGQKNLVFKQKHKILVQQNIIFEQENQEMAEKTEALEQLLQETRMKLKRATATAKPAPTTLKKKKPLIKEMILEELEDDDDDIFLAEMMDELVTAGEDIEDIDDVDVEVDIDLVQLMMPDEVITPVQLQVKGTAPMGKNGATGKELETGKKQESNKDEPSKQERSDQKMAVEVAEAETRAEAEEKARAEAEEKARAEAEEKARAEAEKKARAEAEEKARAEAEEKARAEAEEKARAEVEEKAKVEAEERAKRDAEELARFEELQSTTKFPRSGKRFSTQTDQVQSQKVSGNTRFPKQSANAMQTPSEVTPVVQAAKKTYDSLHTPVIRKIVNYPESMNENFEVDLSESEKKPIFPGNYTTTTRKKSKKKRRR